MDDDPDVRLLLRVALEAIGFVVHEAETGHGGVELVRLSEPDLVTLDLVLPGFGGVEVCRRIRELTGAYIIMITASSDEADRLVGLATGADDYVTKPFSPREVQARVSAMFRRPRLVSSVPASNAIGLVAPRLPAPPPAFGRPSLAERSNRTDRSYRFGGSPVTEPPAVTDTESLPMPRSGEPAAVFTSVPEDAGVLRHGLLVIDSEARVAWYAGVELPLTKIEFDLLTTMAGNPRRVWRRETLLNIVWGGQWSDYHVVEVHIGNLRRKLSDAAGEDAQLIKTVRGIGYRMAPSDQDPTIAP